MRATVSPPLALYPPFAVIWLGNTHVYCARQSMVSLQVFIHQVCAVRLGVKRHSTQAPWGQVSGSQAKTVQYPPGWARSHWRSPVLEQLMEPLQLSPMFCLHPATKRLANNRIVACRIVSAGAYETHCAIANRSALRPMSGRLSSYCDGFGLEWGWSGSLARQRLPRMGSSGSLPSCV